ncbi:hypothetical protein NI17_004035 [Thermobifida halotolerans]|uniref:Uncharacterized protein n=1 Tax=Thermobifida halotolerans TaxID=483545 RepID=A0AA97M4K6_9ACTN|nr:hypothetical protein [Thermobifida halotolerans]UOE20414.1 hypothetical protein NI17_004035 [Thermobifida halotolerans]
MRSATGGPAGDAGVVVGVDLRGIQAYVYSGQRVLDAVGRAAQVESFTRTDGPDGVGDLLGEEVRAVLRDAGGALSVDFAEQAAAREFVARYTRRLRDRADDLVPVVAFVPYGPGEEAPDFVSAYRSLPDRLRRARARHSAAHAPARGYGITAVCSVSGRPAEVVDRSRDVGTGGERVSADVARARRVGREWHRRLNRRLLAGLRAPDGSALELPTEIDQLGRDLGERSRVAVVHLDFNGMGERLGGYDRRLAGVPGSRESVRAQRKLSRTIAALTDGLARDLVRGVAEAVTVDGLGRPGVRGSGAGGTVSLPKEDGRIRVPVRPIVVAGDDLTLVCDARLAFSLVRRAFEWLDADPRRLDPRDVRARTHRAWLALVDGDEETALALAGEKELGWARSAGFEEDGHTTLVPTVGAGVAVQPVGAPLVLGYRVSEALCAEAKRARRRWLAEEGGDDHAVAWTLRLDGADRAVRRLREAEGTGGRSEQPWDGWGFVDFLDRYLSAEREGSLRWGDNAAQRSWFRSALVPLLQRGGDLEAELQRRARGRGARIRLPEDRTPGGLLDAVELLDLHLDVPLGRTGEGAPDGRA